MQVLETMYFPFQAEVLSPLGLLHQSAQSI
jgi:hypothetical protein